MKRIACILFYVFVALPGVMPAARAQQVSDATEFLYQNGKLYADGVPLTTVNAAEYLSAPLAERYVKAYRTERIGATLGLTGVGLFAASGLIFTFAEIKYHSDYTHGMPAGIPIGLMGMALGAVVGVVGLPVWLSGSANIRGIGDAARAQRGQLSAELDFGFTPSGIGLALRF